MMSLQTNENIFGEVGCLLVLVIILVWGCCNVGTGVEMVPNLKSKKDLTIIEIKESSFERLSVSGVSAGVEAQVCLERGLSVSVGGRPPRTPECGGHTEQVWQRCDSFGYHIYYGSDKAS